MFNNQKNNSLYNHQKKNFSNLNMNNNYIQSPYLIPGILNIKRNYDEKYNLNNFIPIFEDGKPKIIGGGSFGQVFLVMNIKNKKLYAIKHMEKKSLSSKLNSLDGIYKEIYIQSRIDHPNVLPILYVNETSSDFDLVLEYASGGSLFHFIRRKKYLNESLAFSLFIQVINAVYFLHKNNLIHRDIKPENILLFDNNIIKLCDFGWCVKLEEGQQRGTFCGTTEYMSPELVNHEEYSKEIDVWSLGVLLYEMVHGYSPFRPDKPNFKPKDVIENIRLHKLKFNKNVGEKCKELIYHLLDENPNKRYKVEDIFYSDFVKFYEERKYGFPDNFLIEKYKFKVTKNNIFNIYNDLENKNKINNTLFPGNYIIKKENEIKECTSEKNNLLNNEKNVYLINDKNLKKINKKEIKESFSDKNIKNENKLYEKKLKKNNTTQYFHPLKSIEKKMNLINLDFSKSKKKRQVRIKTSFNKIDNNKNNKENIDSNNINNQKLIIINNYFPKLINNNFKKNNEEQKNNGEKMNQILPYKKGFQIKPLKMSKIPINIKVGHYAHSPTNRLNSITNKNYLIIKKHLSPKNNLTTENNKANSFQRKNLEYKYIEVKRNKYFHSPKNNNGLINENNCKNKISYNKKTYTRNNINTHYDTTKQNYKSEENISNNKININNKSCSFNLISSNNYDSNKIKVKEKKLSCTKSLNNLKKNYNNNIKSMFISNIKNEINNLNNNSMSEKNCLSNKSNGHIKLKNKSNNLNLNMNDIKKININVFKTQPNSPLNTFNNNFPHINNNNHNKNSNLKNKNNINNLINFKNNNNNFKNSNNKIRIKDIKLNNINNELNYLNFNKKKFHKNNLISQVNNYEEYIKYRINLDKILNNNNLDNKSNINLKNKEYFYDKSSKLLNSMSHSSIFYQNKLKKIQNKKKLMIHNVTDMDKKLKNIPKIKSFKKEQFSNFSVNNIQKLDINEKNRNNFNNNFTKQKIFSLETEKIKNRSNLNSNRDIPNVSKNKQRNNSNKSNSFNDIKLKIIKQLELNDFLNNKKMNRGKKNINNISNDLYFNTSVNQSDNQKISRINTSINRKNCYENFDNKNNLLDFQNNKIMRIYSFASSNYSDIQRKIKEILKPSHNNYSNDQKSLNLDKKIKIIIKKEPKVNINPTIPKQKKDLILSDSENNINIENIKKKYRNKLKYKQNNYKYNCNDIFLDKCGFIKKENHNNYTVGNSLNDNF